MTSFDRDSIEAYLSPREGESSLGPDIRLIKLLRDIYSATSRGYIRVDLGTLLDNWSGLDTSPLQEDGTYPDPYLGKDWADQIYGGAE